MNENEKAYRKVNSFYQDERKSSNVGKNIFVPFLSGVLGSALVMGTCFGVPSIKASLIRRNYSPHIYCKFRATI